MKCNLVFSAFSIKKALDVYLFIWEGCKTEDYHSFEDIRKTLRIGASNCRRITNRLARVGLIESVKDTRYEDRRKKAYVVCNPNFANSLEYLMLTFG